MVNTESIMRSNKQLSFSIDSILGKYHNSEQNIGLSFSGSFTSTNTSSESSSNSPPILSEKHLAQLEQLTKERFKREYDSVSTGSPDSKALMTPDKSITRLSGEFSPLWGDLLAFQCQPNHIQRQLLSPLGNQQHSEHFESPYDQQQSFHSSAGVNQNFFPSQPHLIKSLITTPDDNKSQNSFAQLNASAGRSPRVPFSRHQVLVLETKFRKTHYLSSLEVTELAIQLNLTETRVKIWFQNRRARERRENSINGLSSPSEILSNGCNIYNENESSQSALADLDSSLKLGTETLHNLKHNQDLPTKAISQSAFETNNKILGLTPLILQACWAVQKKFQKPEAMEMDSEMSSTDVNSHPPFMKLKNETLTQRLL